MWRGWRAALVLVGVALVASGCGRAAPSGDAVGKSTQALTQSVTYRRGAHGAVSDTFISSAELKKNFGDDAKLRVSAKNEALIRFDVSDIPSTAVIDSATMQVYLSGDHEDDDDDCDDGDKRGFPVVPITVHRATAAWTEDGATYRNFGQSFDAAYVGVILPTSTKAAKSVDVKSLVQSWVDGSAPNDGVVLRTTAKKHTIIVSSEGHAAALRPALSVTYTTPDDHCAPNPCENGGTCTNGVSSYTCACAPGFTGASCETPIDNCASSPCQNGGSCTNEPSGYSCACAAGFTGASCETNIDDCAGAPCQNGGVCTDGVASHTCACAPGYTGANCETLIDNCAGNPCQNGGVCDNGVGSYTCVCDPAFTGTNCEINVDDCAGNPCQNGGTCADGVGTYTCSCAPGYTGTQCQDLIDNCASDPCQNGGVCTNGVGAYTCACAPGYAGTNCETDIDDCAAQPCHNGGLCVDGVNSFTCQCAAGFTGGTCDVVVPTDPCLANGGTYGTITGDYTLSSSAGLSALTCVGEITGTLRIDGDASIPSVSLPSLHKVGGLVVTATSQVVDLDLSSMQTVTGLVDVENNPLLGTLDLSHATIGGCYVSNDQALTAIKLATFAPQVSYAFIQGTPLLTDLGPGGLSGVTNASQVRVIGTALTNLGPTGLSNLATVGNRLDINGNPQLTSVGTLSSLSSVATIFAFQNDPLLTTIDARNAVLGGFYLDGDVALTSFRFGSLPSTATTAFIRNSPLLSDIGPDGLSALKNVTGELRVDGTALTSLGPTGLSNLTSVDGFIRLSNNPLLTSFGSLSQLTRAAYLEVQNDPLLTAIDAPNAVLGGFYLDGDVAVTSFRFGPLPSPISAAFIRNSPLLSDIGPDGLSALTQVTGELRIDGTALTDLGPTGLSNLTSVGGYLRLRTNPNLASVGSLSQLSHITLGLDVEGDPLLTSLDFPALTSLTELYVATNAGLTSVSAPLLPALGTSITINGNPALTQIDLAALGSVTNDFSIQSNASLCQSIPVGILAHTAVGGTTSITGNKSGC